MKKKSYQDTIKDHLEIYKKSNSVLCNLPDGTFRGKPKKYPHILETHDIIHNLIDGLLIKPAIDVTQVGNITTLTQNTNNNIHLHQYAHHLNSSQMMCINFFAPFISRNQSATLLKLLGMPNPHCGISEFEFEHIEGTREKTNFDFFLKTNDGRKVFFEIKYTEQEFSRSTKANKDSKKRRWNEIYSLATANNPHFKGLVEDDFYRDYQIYRNLFYVANPSDFVFFIVPKANTALVEQLKDLHISSTLKGNTKFLFWEDLNFAAVQEYKSNKSLHDYFVKFGEKYML